MFRRLYPSEDTQSIYDIDFRSFHERGYNTALFDIDNTLVEHGAPATERVIDFFKDLHGIVSFQAYPPLCEDTQLFQAPLKALHFPR
jgi:predicted HAD superfamily phosphohydrolase YqeG